MLVTIAAALFIAIVGIGLAARMLDAVVGAIVDWDPGADARARRAQEKMLADLRDEWWEARAQKRIRARALKLARRE